MVSVHGMVRYGMEAAVWEAKAGIGCQGAKSSGMEISERREKAGIGILGFSLRGDWDEDLEEPESEQTDW